MVLKRVEGGEQPYIPAGPFKIRIPLVHFEWQWPEFFQGLILCATCLGAIPVLTEYLGVSFEVALTMVIINGGLYMLHYLLGDPVVPGWITPAIPLIMAFMTKYQMGPERTQALIALQLLVAFAFLFLGSTGLAFRLVKLIPDSLKAGVILGAGISAVMNVMQVRFASAPIVITIGTVIAFYLLFSDSFKSVARKNRFMWQLAKYGMLPSIIVALIVGPFVKELPFPQIEWGISTLHISELINGYTIFGIGFPKMGYFIDALPLLIAVYIIAFGDFVLAESVIGAADKDRPDELIQFNPNRSNLISGIRNFIMAIVAPYTQLCGPLWAAVTVSVAERYKMGKDSMYSLWGGIGTFRIATFFALWLMPIVSLVKPCLPVALALTLVVQGFACSYIAMNMIRSNAQRGVAGFMAVILATKGAAWGLAAGVVFYLVCEYMPKSLMTAPATNIKTDA